MPIVAGSEINDDPYAPDLAPRAGCSSPSAATTRRSSGSHRDRRFGEKLATPDTSIADLIGEVDPIKVAEGRYLSDELTIHYGLVPRTNRGIFAINELPDLAERIQVGLLNVLEERDVQIRGYKIRLPLDVMLVASANPEDYTNRGRIITPLKDRFGAQIRTHYPLDVEHRDGRHRAGGARRSTPTGLDGRGPEFMTEIVAEISQQARRSPHINQRSGVSVRAVDRQLRDARRQRHAPGAAQRRERGRAARQRPRRARRRRTAGKIEFETVDDGREEQVLDRIVKARGARGVPGPDPAREAQPSSSRAFDDGLVVHTGDDVAVGRVRAAASRTCPACASALGDLGVGETPAGRRVGGRVRARGPAPLEAPQQGRRRRPSAAYRGRG